MLSNVPMLLNDGDVTQVHPCDNDCSLIVEGRKARRIARRSGRRGVTDNCYCVVPSRRLNYITAMQTPTAKKNIVSDEFETSDIPFFLPSLFVP